MKWKLYQMLYIIVTRIESDTSKMTAAKGAIAKMQETCALVEDGVDSNVVKDLKTIWIFAVNCVTYLMVVIMMH